MGRIGSTTVLVDWRRRGEPDRPTSQGFPRNPEAGHRGRKAIQLLHISRPSEARAPTTNTIILPALTKQLHVHTLIRPIQADEPSSTPLPRT